MTFKNGTNHYPNLGHLSNGASPSNEGVFFRNIISCILACAAL